MTKNACRTESVYYCMGTSSQVLGYLSPVIAATFVTKDTLQVITWSRLHKATQEDRDMAKIIEHVEKGFTESQNNVTMEIQGVPQV